MTNANMASLVGAPLDEHRRAPAERMSELLRRYPNIPDEERLALVDFLKSGHPDELAKATYGNGLEPRAIAVKKDHPEHFRVGWRGWLPWIAAGIVMLLLLYVTH